MKPAASRTLRLSRLESLAALAGGVTHEMNNLAASVALCVELLEPSCREPADREMLLSLGGVARRLQHAGRQLHWLARGIDGEPTLFQPQYLLADVQKLGAIAFSSDVAFIVRYPSDLRALAGQPLHLHHLLLSMALEARHHLPPGGGTVILAATNQPPDRVALQAWIEPAAGAKFANAANIPDVANIGNVPNVANAANGANVAPTADLAHVADAADVARLTGAAGMARIASAARAARAARIASSRAASAAARRLASTVERAAAAAGATLEAPGVPGDAKDARDADNASDADNAGDARDTGRRGGARRPYGGRRAWLAAPPLGEADQLSRPARKA